MVMSERDKFLTEAMGYSNVHINDYGQIFGCNLGSINSMRESVTGNNGFSTWQGFGKLWEWVQSDGDRWVDFHRYAEGTAAMMGIPTYIIEPDRFANAVYEFLKDRQ
jgi:hypothetical protein